METPPSPPLKKPKTFMLAGVILLILGIFYLLGLTMKVVSAAIPAMREQDPTVGLLETDPSYVPVHYANLFMSGGLGVVAVCAGVGLIKGRNWGRHLGIVWAVFVILTAPYHLWVANKYMMPLMKKQLEADSRTAQAGEVGLAFAKAATIGSLVFMVILGILLIIFLVRPKMKAWCRLQETTQPQVPG